MCVLEIPLAMCTVTVPDDVWQVKSVRCDVDDCVGKDSCRPGRTGGKIRASLADWRRCTAARVAARQKAVDSATVVDSYDGIAVRRWRADSTMVTGDCRAPILWVTTVIGLQYDCYSAFRANYDDYHPVL